MLLWAVKEQSDENENWPATRIATYWASRFRKRGWALPNPDELDADTTERHRDACAALSPHPLDNSPTSTASFVFQPEAP